MPRCLTAGPKGRQVISGAPELLRGFKLLPRGCLRRPGVVVSLEASLVNYLNCSSNNAIKRPHTTTSPTPRFPSPKSSRASKTSYDILKY